MEPRRHFGIDAKTRLGDVPFHYFNPFRQKFRGICAVALEQRVEDGRFSHHFLESFLRRIGLLPADQQMNFLYLRQFEQRIDQPDLADESRDSDEHDLLSGKSSADRQGLAVAAIVEVDQRTRNSKDLAL